MTNIVSTLVNSNAEKAPLAFHASPVMPMPPTGCGSSKKLEPFIVNASAKQSEATPSSPLPNPLKILHRRNSSTKSLPRTCSLYAGPQPTGRDGCPLRSCIKSSSSLSLASSDVFARSGPANGRRVSFSYVKLREYCRQVGDNPSVSSGCPIAIGWKFNKRGMIDIDSYEADHDIDPIPCRRLSSKDRERILTEIGGISQTQIMQGQVQAYFDRQQRDETLGQIGGPKNCMSVGPRERLFTMRESAARKFVRAKRGSSPNKEQQELWDNAHEAARQRFLRDIQKT